MILGAVAGGTLGCATAIGLVVAAQATSRGASPGSTTLVAGAVALPLPAVMTTGGALAAGAIAASVDAPVAAE